MSDVELLRKAAATMRERAEDVAGPTRWEPGERCIWDAEGNVVVRDGTQGDGGFEFSSDAAYAAAMDPVVALAVADWLDNAANRLAYADAPRPEFAHALVVARAYLREDA